MNSLCWVLSVRCFIRLLLLLEDAAVLPLDNFTENSLQSVLLWVSSLLIKNICPDRCHFLSPVTRYARISGLWVRVNERRRTNTSTGPTPRLQSAVRRGQRCNWTDITSHPPLGDSCPRDTSPVITGQFWLPLWWCCSSHRPSVQTTKLGYTEDSDPTSVIHISGTVTPSLNTIMSSHTKLMELKEVHTAFKELLKVAQSLSYNDLSL